MDARAAQLIDFLGLAPHPEGGHFREVYRSASRVQPLDSRSERLALTTIYFLLAQGEVSRWHRVASDEVWHYYEGDALELFTLDPELGRLGRHVLGPVAEGVQPVSVVPAGDWQAARSLGAYTLVGCSVGPSFEFEDFELLGEQPAAAEVVRGRYADLACFL
jgi:predicted cupin superfamily sugar epimerase